MNRIIASQVKTSPLEERLPNPYDWAEASSICFCHDWCGRNEDLQRQTEVRILWSFNFIFIQFQCRYRELFVFEDQNNRRDELWLRDVAEIFIQTGADEIGNYREFEISPNGDWLDLDIAPEKKTHLAWSIESRVLVNPKTKTWTAEMAIPMSNLAPAFHPSEIWKINLFRIEGSEPDRFYSAWQPTHTAKANFHVPACFAELWFQ
jgi:alpha-galactosidase